MVQDQRRAYAVVDLFEQELCDYTGAPFAIAVNSCTNALLLSLWRERLERKKLCQVQLPRNTYIGVLQSVLNSGHSVNFWDGWTQGWYQLQPRNIIDAARTFYPEMFPQFWDCHVCLSFHSAKQLPLGRGGAILTGTPEAAEWFRAARMDGRPPGEDRVVFPGWHMPMSPDVAARGLDVLSRWNDKGYSPPPLPHEDYPDLSLWYP